jgi:hypothetical protein
MVQAMCRCVLWGPSVPGLSVDPPLVCPVSPVCDTGHSAKCPVSQTEVYVRLDCRVGVFAWFLWYSWLAAGTRWWRRENPLDGLEHTRTSINLDFKIYGHGSSVLICIHDSGFVRTCRQAPRYRRSLVGHRFAQRLSARHQPHDAPGPGSSWAAARFASTNTGKSPHQIV